MFGSWLTWLNAQPDGTRDLIVGLVLALATGAVGWMISWVVRAVQARFHRAAPDDAWRAMEARFDRINGEVEGIRNTYESGLVLWQLHGSRPDDWRRTDKHGEDARRVQRFQSEAKNATRLFRQQHPKVPVGRDPVDDWLNLVATHVHSASSISGDGYDDRGHYESFHIERLVDGSKVLCATLAADVEAA